MIDLMVQQRQRETRERRAAIHAERLRLAIVAEYRILRASLPETADERPATRRVA